MEAAINLLSSSPSFPPRTHFRSIPPSSSVPLLNEQTSVVPAMPSTSLWRQFPASVLSHEQRDESKPSISTLREDRASESSLETQKIEDILFLEEHKETSVQYLGDLEHKFYHSSDFQNLLPCLGNNKHSKSAAAENPMNDVIYLAREALSASKLALSLAESSEVLDADLDVPTSLSLKDDLMTKEKIVRSPRLLERRTKKRRSSRPKVIRETDRLERTYPKRSSEGFDQNDPLRLFLWGPETKQLLTIEEENELIRQIQDHSKLVAVKKKLQSQFEREPTFAEWADAVGMSLGTLRSQIHSEKRSRDKLIYANFRMVVYIAKQYQGRGLSLQDLMQEGSIGLMKSVEKFKPQAGCRFSSYAYWWIRQAITKAIFQNSRTIRLPESMYSLLGKVLEAKKLCTQEGNPQPTTEQLAQRVGITVEKLQNLLVMMRHPVSMQGTVWADQDTTFQEVTADTRIEAPDICVERQVMRKHIRNLVGTLSHKEEQIIKMRYGIGSVSEKRYSLSEIGDIFGLSKERVRQLESRALNKLKELLDRHGLNAYTELLL